MGYIHETNSGIFGIEERDESVYLRDDSDDGSHLFFHHQRPDTVRSGIVAELMRRAGTAFASGDEEEANRLKRCATEVSTVTLEEYRIASVEATKLWLRDLCDFIAKHKMVLEP